MFLPKQTSEKQVNAVVSALVDYFSLPDYGIVWNDGERTIPEIWLLHPARRFTYLALLSLNNFAVKYSIGKHVLDFGCGVGYGSYYLASRGAEKVLGIDIDRKSTQYAMDRYIHEKVAFKEISIEALNNDGRYRNQFDLVFSSNVMEHVPDYLSVLSSIKDLLSPNGIYIQITPPSGDPKGNPFHVTNFTVPEWHEILLEYFPNQRFFAHIPQRNREDTNNEFEFVFEECGHIDMGRLKSISGIIICYA